ncbi:MAG: transporter [Betaproteobacteria bacterium HGW-Betaproteobacteria-17]|nr:MAG: transporter [Betaproteobacteria bacterium HGW-Betaproteobacteria-17]
MRNETRQHLDARAFTVGTLALAACACGATPAHAAHPLLTEDSGTQGAGRTQLEITYDQSTTRAADSRTRGQHLNVVLSYGFTDTLDLIAGLPYARITERGATNARVKGYADMEIAAKWRFYEAGPLSIALRPGLRLPTGDEDRGLGSGHSAPSLFAVMTHSADPWAVHLHLGYTRNFHDSPKQRNHLYHASMAGEYSVSESLRLVADASTESNPELAGHPHVGSLVLGLVYSVMHDLDIDLGYRRGLTEPAADHTWLAGLALRF